MTVDICAVSWFRWLIDLWLILFLELVELVECLWSQEVCTSIWFKRCLISRLSYCSLPLKTVRFQIWKQIHLIFLVWWGLFFVATTLYTFWSFVYVSKFSYFLYFISDILKLLFHFVFCFDLFLFIVNRSRNDFLKQHDSQKLQLWALIEICHFFCKSYTDFSYKLFVNCHELDQIFGNSLSMSLN